MTLQMIGRVASNMMSKTVVVLVARRRWINKYKGWYRYTRKYMAHDELDTCNIGDVVKIEQLPYRLSARKAFNVIEILQRENIVARDKDAPYDPTVFKRPADWAYLPTSARPLVEQTVENFAVRHSVSENARNIADEFYYAGCPKLAEVKK